MIKLNLIPPYKKEEIEQSNKLLAVLGWEIKLSGILLVFVSMLLSINYILQLNLASMSIDFDSGTGKNNQIKKLIEYDEKIKEMNLIVSKEMKLQNGQLIWSNLFQKLNENFPESIELKSITTENYAVLLSGIAQKRDELIAFRDKLEKEDCFSEVDLPLSNLVMKENIDFRINFNIKSDCLK